MLSAFGRRFLPFLLILYLWLGMGQKYVDSDYVVTISNDTLYGHIKNRKEGPFGKIYEKVRFRSRGVKKRFSPDDITTYKKDDELYKTGTIDGKKHFLQLVLEGQVIHYIYEFQEQGEELIHKVSYFKNGNSDLIRADLGLLGVRRKKLIRLFNDCPPLLEKLENKELNSAFDVAAFYNEWAKENLKG